MNRIDKKFCDLKLAGRKALITFITAGDPDLKTTEEFVLSFEKAGVDIIELGVPFSDPLADGPTIQASSARALKNDINIPKILKLVKSIRKKSQVPIALMTYINPVFHYGEERFINEAKSVGVDGLIIPDLPLEEGENLRFLAKNKDLSTIFFLSPTTTLERIKKTIDQSTGFIYYVALTGTTGVRNLLPSNLISDLKKIKHLTRKPICVGFGISQASQITTLSEYVDGVIVGSAIINQITNNLQRKNLVQKVTEFVKSLK